MNLSNSAPGSNACIDRELCLKLSNNNPSLAAELLQMLLAELPGNYHAIEQAFTDSKFENALDLIHQLHNACCYCGVPELKSICKALEYSLKANLSHPDQQLTNRLKAAVDELLHWHREHSVKDIFW